VLNKIDNFVQKLKSEVTKQTDDLKEELEKESKFSRQKNFTFFYRG
jgi:hypothetical protein